MKPAIWSLNHILLANMSVMHLDDYEYLPLPNPSSIRVISFQHTRGGVLPSLCGYPLIQCTMHTLDLNRIPDGASYEALSYTWDSPAPEKHKRKRDNWTDEYGPLCKWPVVVSSNMGKPSLLYVRKNLFDALRHLQNLHDVDRRVDDFDKTRLHVAVEDADDQTVKALLGEGASCGARDCFGETPLHCMY